MSLEEQKLIDILNQQIIETTQGDDRIAPITQINNHLFLGQGRTTAYVEILQKLGVTHVVSIGRSPHQAVKNGPFIKLEVQNVTDASTENLVTHFPTIFAFLRQAIKDGGKIYLHCEAGCSRSPTIAIAFLRANGDYDSLQQAYDAVKSKRPWIDPNVGFKQQLRDFFLETLSI
jgi:predicted protein tyrosine phosphatase